MTLLYANNAWSTLQAAIDADDLSLVIHSDDAGRFPSPVDDESFRVVLWDGTNFEIVDVTTRAGSVLTMARGQEGTTPTAFLAGTAVRHGPTAAAFENLPQMATITNLLADKSDTTHTHALESLGNVDAAGAPAGSILVKGPVNWEAMLGFYSDIVLNSSTVSGDTVTEALEFIYNAISGGIGGLGDLAALDTVGSAQIDNNAVTQAKMATDSVGTDELIDGNVSEAKLANLAVTFAKLATTLLADVANLRAAATQKLMTTDLIETASAWVTLVYAASYTPNWDNFINGQMTLTGNLSLVGPTNAQPGTWRTIRFIQDATGSRTITFATTGGVVWRFPRGVDPVLATAAGSIDKIQIQAISATEFEVHHAADMKA